MKLNNDNIKETIDNEKLLLDKEKNISPALRSVFQLLLAFMQVMIDRLNLNSKNSSKPLSSDPNRKKSNKPHKLNKKPGAQPGRIGKQLKLVSDPDQIKLLKVDKRTLPRDTYTEAEFEARQVVDFEVSICVTEYRAQVLIGSDGQRYVASFPSHVKRPIQYGPKTKASAVYILTPNIRLFSLF